MNAPKCPFHSYHRDGAMRTDGNLGATLNYHPNSQGLWSNQPEYAEPSLELEGYAARYNHYLEDGHYEQPGILFRKTRAAAASFENTTRAINGRPRK